MEAPSSLPESTPQPQSEPQPQPQSEPQQADPLNPQIHDQSQQQYAQQPQDYYYQNPNPNPTQQAAYDYYNYYHQYPYQTQWQYPQQPHHYPYYQPDYSAAYQQQHPPGTHPPPPESAPGVSVSAPGVSVSAPAPAPYDGMQVADASAAAAQPMQQPQHHQQGAYPPGPGMNPAAAAAIAALERLTQFAGTMGAAERAMAGIPAYNPGFGPVPMHPPDARYPQRGRGRRGGGWVNVGQRNGPAPPFRGRGRGRGPRGRGRSRHGQERGAPSSSHPEPSTGIADADQSAPALETIAPNARPVQMAWCELCRVDCTSLEILEQHKNGKKHKKNLLRFEEMQNKAKPVVEEIPNVQVPVIDAKPEAAEQTQVAPVIEEQKAVENLPSEATSKEPIIKDNLQNDAAKLPEVPAETSDQQENNPRLNKFDNRRPGLKRKMKVGRGGKRMKISEGRRRPIEPPKPKVVIPLICDLCNVKCDTQEVLDRHLSGKKHIAKLKRFEGHQAMYGSQGLQMLYPPNPIAQAHFVAQAHQPFCGPMGSFPPQGGPFPFQPHQSTAGLEPQVSQIPMPQVLPQISTPQAPPQISTPQAPEATVTVQPNPATAVTGGSKYLHGFH
ncbi:hypothetical protein M5689_007771 [Euphorbia peplus]|nr:hypothetical protein M5689_007771 [Euphorbia peplus]